MFEISNICFAFAQEGIGTLVTNKEAFFGVLQQALAEYDASQDRVAGQHIVRLPKRAIDMVSCGYGKRTNVPTDYVARKARDGSVGRFLRREKAAVAENVTVVVYTRNAYLADPNGLNDEPELTRIANSSAAYVIVAVIAWAGPMPPVNPKLFVSAPQRRNRLRPRQRTRLRTDKRRGGSFRQMSPYLVHGC